MAGCGICLSGVLDEETSIEVVGSVVWGQLVWSCDASGMGSCDASGLRSCDASGMGHADSPTSHLGTDTSGCVLGGGVVRRAGGTDGCCSRAHADIPLSHMDWGGGVQ